MNSIKVVKILRKGKKTCRHVRTTIGTEWDKNKKHHFIRVCLDCRQVEECFQEQNNTKGEKESR